MIMETIKKKSSPTTPVEDRTWLEKYFQEPHYQVADSILETKIDYLDLVGTGKNQKEAFGNVFEKLKKEIYKHYNFIIHLEPLDVIKIKDSSDLKIKKFFGFLPHRVLNWEVSLRIVYQVKFINEI
jgi:hypothetical protein